MDLTTEERAEWIDDATDAIRGRMILRRLSAKQAYTALSGERAWRDELSGAILREGYERMTTGEKDLIIDPWMDYSPDSAR